MGVFQRVDGIGSAVRHRARRPGNSVAVLTAILAVLLLTGLAPPAEAGVQANNFNRDAAEEVVSWDSETGVWSVRQFDGAVDTVHWGTKGDIAVVGDVDGDGKDDRVIWRPSNGRWYALNNAGEAVLNERWGIAGDIPLMGDIDGDGSDDMIIWRPSNGRWYVKSSTTKQVLLNKPWGHGSLDDVPLVGDLDGDGRDDIIIWRPEADATSGRFYAKNPDWRTILNRGWGTGKLGDIPLVGDVNNDGAEEVVIYRPGRAEWFPMSIDGSQPVGVLRNGSRNATPLLTDVDGNGVDDLVTVRQDTFWEAYSVTGERLFSGLRLGSPGATSLSGDFGFGEVVLNEIRELATNWVELHNPSDLSINVYAYTLENKRRVPHTITSDGNAPLVVVAPGDHHVVVPRFGIVAPDFVKLSNTQGNQIDRTSIRSRPTHSWGRCPDGVGRFAGTAAETRGTANIC